MSDQKMARWSNIKIRKMTSLDGRVIWNLHKFRSRKTAKEYLENTLLNMVSDAFKAGKELHDAHDSLAAYVLGRYSSRIENSMKELISLEIRDMLKNVK